MRAMAAQQPGIPQVDNHRQLAAQPGKNTEIKIIAVEIMTMKDIRFLGRQVQYPSSARMAKTLQTEKLLYQLARMSQRSVIFFETPYTTNFVLEPSESSLHTIIRVVPKAVRNNQHVWIFGFLVTDCQPRLMASRAIGVKEVPCGALGSAAAIRRIYRQDAQLLAGCTQHSAFELYVGASLCFCSTKTTCHNWNISAAHTCQVNRACPSR